VQYSPFGVVLSQPTFDTPFLFNGLYGVMTDGNRLNYMRARYYSAEIRRFVNQDILLGSIADGQSLNRFAFVTGNPVTSIDPFGLYTIVATTDSLIGHNLIAIQYSDSQVLVVDFMPLIMHLPSNQALVVLPFQVII
jgi:RHS repeat-associated protein